MLRIYQDRDLGIAFLRTPAHHSSAGNEPRKNPKETIMSDSKKNEIVLTPRQLADELHMDQKSLRRIMRSMAAETPGQGSRWEIGEDFADALRERVSRTHNRKTVRFVPKTDSV